MAADLGKLDYPFDWDYILRKQKSLKRTLLARENITYIEKRIAILCGSTVDDIRNTLELFLLQSGIRPSFWQSEYNKYYEDAVFGNAELDEFAPDMILIFTSAANLIEKPVQGESEAAVQAHLEAEMERFARVWEGLARYHAVVIQNNMELPYDVGLGSLAAVEPYGISRYIEVLNQRFAAYATSHEGFYLHDLHGLAARVGLCRWHNPAQYFAYKFAMDYDVMPKVALSLAVMIRAILGKNRKCLVLDLDNTLWGGVIGDDGMENIQIGHETAVAEGYTAFQRYVRDLKERGIILAVCSKNENAIARQGFSHPDSVLKLEDFASFYANWEPKDQNIRAIAEELSIGTDSMVFLDDNPAERALVHASLPEVAVPEVRSTEGFSFIRALEDNGYFEPIAISEDDRRRAATYAQNKERRALAAAAGNYDDFLRSLDMRAEIAPFQPVYYDRIAQLTNKTNQFNLTTRRYTRADIVAMAEGGRCITLYGRLADRFGDNGLVSVVVGEMRERELHILLWLMSCRVLKRGMEQAMLDALVSRAREAGCTCIIGYYFPTKKNQMVAALFADFGFEEMEQEGAATKWKLGLDGYQKKARFIKVEEQG